MSNATDQIMDKIVDQAIKNIDMDKYVLIVEDEIKSFLNSEDFKEGFREAFNDMAISWEIAEAIAPQLKKALRSFKFDIKMVKKPKKKKKS